MQQQYSPISSFRDFFGRVVGIGDTVVFSSPTSCTKDDTPLRTGVVKSIRTKAALKWKILIRTPGEDVIELLSCKRVILLPKVFVTQSAVLSKQAA